MLENDGQGRELATSRCKILSGLSLFVVIAEITSVYKWKTTYYDSQSQFRVDILSGGRPDFKKNGGTNTARLFLRNFDEATIQISQKTSDKEPEVQTFQASPTACLVTKPPGGRVRLSNESLEELGRRLKAATEKKVILVWIALFGVKTPINVDAAQCGNCEVTYNRSRIDDENVGAVLFHFHALRADNMPENRNPKQLYIFWNMESTATLRVVRRRSLEFEDSFKFNATMTYRRDSEFYQSYEYHGTVESIVKNNKLSLQDLLKLKSKLAVAIVSNCRFTPGARIRMKMLEELNNLKFGFEGYGGCFGRRILKNRGKREFLEDIQKYKFYLSFENSKHCKDYITEKVFNNALRSLSVPVVWGAKREDYEAVLPSGSFIFAEDFSTMKALSEYLTYLDQNDTAYLEYFRWLTRKPSEMPQYGRARSWCQICRVLHGINTDDIYSTQFDESNFKRPLFTDTVATRTVESLIDWYYGEDNPECFSR